MVILRRFLPFIGSIIILACYIGVIYQPLRWKEWIIGLAVFFVLSIAFMNQWKWANGKTWLSAFPLMVLLIGGTGMLFFVEGSALRLLLVAFLSVVYGVFMENLFTLRFQPARYTSLALPKMSLVFNILSTFFVFSTLFALHLIALVDSWVISVFAVVFAIGHMRYLLNGFNVSSEKATGIVVTVSVLFMQLITVMHFLPTGFYVNGAFSAIGLYFITSYYLMVARDAYTKRLFIENIIITAVLLAGLLGTAQWIF